VDRAPPPVTANVRAFRTLVRNELFRRVELAAAQRWDALGELGEHDGWTAARWREALAPYFAEHGEIPIDADARSARFLVLEETGRRWTARQILADPAGDHDWSITAEVDLDASDETGEAEVRVVAVGPVA